MIERPDDELLRAAITLLCDHVSACTRQGCTHCGAIATLLVEFQALTGLLAQIEALPERWRHAWPQAETCADDIEAVLGGES